MAELATEKRLICTLSVASGVSGTLSYAGSSLQGTLSFFNYSDIDGGDFVGDSEDNLDGGNFSDWSSGDSVNVPSFNYGLHQWDGGTFAFNDGVSLDGGDFADYSSGDTADGNAKTTINGQMSCSLSPVESLSASLSKAGGMTGTLSILAGGNTVTIG